MTEAALLEALRAARSTPTMRGVRVEEITAATGLSGHTVRSLLRRAMAAGTVRRTLTTMEQISGVMRRVPAYEAAP
jgi:DNA-binding transcriptional regulator LsrR (DeoR family)